VDYDFVQYWLDRIEKKAMADKERIESACCRVKQLKKEKGVE